MGNGYERLPGSSGQPKAWTTWTLTLICFLFVIANIVYLLVNLNNDDTKSSANATTDDHSATNGPIVRLPFGEIEGLRTVEDSTTVLTFLGVPFAEPPVGNLRFKKPLPWTRTWTGIRNAQKQPPACLQPRRSGDSKVLQDNSEDCLYLNIWTSADHLNTNLTTIFSERLPVFVFCFGGAFKFGSIAVEKYNGEKLTSAINAVIVEMNSRLGPLGFFNGGSDEAPPNVGLHDQVMALKWVQENIHLFGGNPDSVTLSGVSTGSMTVSMHILSPLSSPLFHRAFLMSGTVLRYPDVFSLETSLNQSSLLSEELGCGSSIAGRLTTESIDCLRKLDGKLLLQNQSVNVIPKNNHYGNLMFFPTYGDEFLPDEPLKLLQKRRYKKNASFVFGHVVHEGSEIARYEDPVEENVDLRIGYGNQLTKLLNEIGGNFSLAANDARQIYFEGIDENEAYTMYTDALGDFKFVCTVKIFAEALSRENSVYEYVLTYPPTVSSNAPLAPAHGDDVGLLFGTLVVSESDKVVSKKLQKEARSFVSNGTVSWTPYYRTSSNFLVNTYHEFNVDNTTLLPNLDEYRSLTCSFWKHNVWPEALEFGNCS